MNSDLISVALTNIDEKFIMEARAERVTPEKRRKTKLVISSVACACACAIALCVSLPIALSHSNSSAVPPHIGTENPPDDIKPPKPDIENPPSQYFEAGFVSNGLGEPISPLMIAYKSDRQFDADAESISVQLSFGEWRYDYSRNWGTNIIISVYNSDSKQTITLKNFSAKEFLDPEYDVKIKCTIEENEEGELVTTSETRIFNHEETFSFPSSMFNKDRGVLIFNILAYDGDEYISGSGVDIYYAKRDGKINIITYKEYREIEQSAQTPPKTDITVTPA